MERSLERLPLEPSYQEKLDKARFRYLKMPLKHLVEKFKDRKAEKEKIETALEEVNLSLAALESLVLEKFLEEGLTSVKTADGATLFVRTSVYPRVSDKRAVMRWIQENRLTELLMVSHTSLRSLCTEFLENGKSLPDGVDCFMKDALSLRKAKGE